MEISSKKRGMTVMYVRLNIRTTTAEELVDITEDVENAVEKSEVKDGLCIVFAKHTTAGILINEAVDANLREDIIRAFEEIIPKIKFKHECSRRNAAAHIKATIIGAEKIIPVKDSKLELGRWQGIFFAEFDGPRSRTVVVEVIPDKNAV